MNATRIPTGGPDDLEALLRSELGTVADAVGSDGRPAPVSALLVRGRTAKRRRRAAVAAAAAAVTALAVVVGFTVVGSAPVVQQRQGLVPQPAGPVPVGPSFGASALEAWARSLPAGRSPGDFTSPKSSQDVVRWEGRAVTLPDVAGRGRFALPLGRSDRGLLLSWFSAKVEGTEDFGMQLGWLSPDARAWSPVETVVVTNAALSADGKRYAYTGSVRDAATSKVTSELVVRRTSDDKVVARTTIPEGRYLLGWILGRPAVRDQEGGELFTYDAATLQPAGSILAPPGAGSAARGSFVSISGSTVQVVTPGDCQATEQTGPLSVYTAVTLADGARTTSLDLGCAPDDMQFVSPDGRWVVRPGDEATVRSATTGKPVGALNPTGWPSGTIAVWEPDSRHVQVVTRFGPDAAATIVRCSVTDGSCARLQ